ncbi:MAG: serine kinase, partial [Clostridia bacterium]
HTIRAMAKEVRQDAQQVLEKLYKTPLFSEMDQSIIDGTLAHRDVASHNFLITQSGSCYLIDLDTVDYDIQLVDLVQLMSRMLLMQGYRFDSFMEAIEAYTKVKPLSDAQIWMVFQMLRYPDNVLREVTGVYLKRPGYSARGVYELLQMERRLRNERRAFLQSEQRIFQRIGPYTYVG